MAHRYGPDVRAQLQVLDIADVLNAKAQELQQLLRLNLDNSLLAMTYKNGKMIVDGHSVPISKCLRLYHAYEQTSMYETGDLRARTLVTSIINTLSVALTNQTLAQLTKGTTKSSMAQPSWNASTRLGGRGLTSLKKELASLKNLVQEQNNLLPINQPSLQGLIGQFERFIVHFPSRHMIGLGLGFGAMIGSALKKSFTLNFKNFGLTVRKDAARAMHMAYAKGTSIDVCMNLVSSVLNVISYPFAAMATCIPDYIIQKLECTKHPYKLNDVPCSDFENKHKDKRNGLMMAFFSRGVFDTLEFQPRLAIADMLENSIKRIDEELVRRMQSNLQEPPRMAQLEHALLDAMIDPERAPTVAAAAGSSAGSLREQLLETRQALQHARRANTSVRSRTEGSTPVTPKRSSTRRRNTGSTPAGQRSAGQVAATPRTRSLRRPGARLYPLSPNAYGTLQTSSSATPAAGRFSARIRTPP